VSHLCDRTRCSDRRDAAHRLTHRIPSGSRTARARSARSVCRCLTRSISTTNNYCVAVDRASRPALRAGVRGGAAGHRGDHDCAWTEVSWTGVGKSTVAPLPIVAFEQQRTRAECRLVANDPQRTKCRPEVVRDVPTTLQNYHHLMPAQYRLALGTQGGAHTQLGRKGQ
jgi:hypothetical protein